jgi:excisionase family DNA binding protein
VTAVLLDTPEQWLIVARGAALLERERRRAGLPSMPSARRLADECDALLAAYFRGRTTRANKTDAAMFACATMNLTTREAAERLGVSPRAVQQAAKRGRLPYTVVGGDYRFSSTDVEIYAQRSIA